jgi:cell wall assembly regulator SMI1
MSLAQTLMESVERARLAGQDVAINPGMTPDEIAALERKCGASLPADVRELVENSAGFAREGLFVEFAGNDQFGYEPVAPHGVAIAPDGFGNSWVCDVLGDGSWGAVLFLCHDPSVVVIQSRSLAEFIDQVFAWPDPSDWNGLADAAVSEVWRRNPHVQPREEALASPDDTLRAFAQSIEAGYDIADLRAGESGTGFSLGRAMQEERCGDLLLFAVERKPPGRLSRLFR